MTSRHDVEALTPMIARHLHHSRAMSARLTWSSAVPARLLWLLLVAMVSGCATASVSPPPRTAVSRPPSARPPVPIPSDFEQTGTASWYGKLHHGKRTA